MALPPKGDPRRPLHLAARSMRVLGLLLLVVASCVGFALSRMLGVGAASGMVWIKLIMIGVFALYAVPGVCYFIFPIYMMRRKLWAVIASIVLVSVHLLFALLGFSGIILSALIAPNQQTPVTLIPLVVIFLVIAALGQLLWHLSKCFEAIKYMPADEHGFEPILPAQLYVAPPTALQVGQPPIAPSGDRHDYTRPPELDRPLRNAIQSLKLLGAASGLWGFMFVFVWGYFNKWERFRPHFIAMGLIVWAIPGVVFFFCGWLIERERQRRTAVIAMITALCQCLFAGVGLVASLVLPPVSPIPILLAVMWVAALVQLFVHLKRALPLLAIDTEHRHGFDVQQVTMPVQPISRETDSCSDAHPMP